MSLLVEAAKGGTFIAMLLVSPGSFVSLFELFIRLFSMLNKSDSCKIKLLEKGFDLGILASAPSLATVKMRSSSACGEDIIE